MSHSLFHIGARNKLRLHEDSQHQNNSFMRKYQQQFSCHEHRLVNQHRAGSPKPKHILFKSHRAISHENLRTIGSLPRAQTSLPKSSRHKPFMSPYQNFRKRAKSASEQESLEISAIHSQSSQNKAATQNPQINWVPVISKVGQVKNQSYQNILINKKLGMDLNTKNELEKHIEKLKSEITKEKNAKFRTIKNVQKMLNSLSNVENMLEKAKEQRIRLNEQIHSCENEFFKEAKRNEKLESIHSRNLKTIKQEKRLIENYEKCNEQTKATLILEKYHLNITKDNFFIERNRLLKNQTKFEQASHEREKICLSVSLNAVRNLVERQIQIFKA